MPELPDVEGFRRVVADHATGSEVRSVRVLDPGVVHTSATGFTRALEGRVLGEPIRWGKWLRVPTRSRPEYPQLLAHFGMTGAFVWTSGEDADHRHDRVVFEFRDGSLRYRDMRKLTGLWLATEESDVAELLGELGPDAAGVSRRDLRERLTRTSRRLKPALMDQTAVAGLGNLCVDEILWRSRLAPTRSTADLDSAQWARLHARLRSVLRSSSRVGHVPDRPSWLTGHRDERDARCPRCSTALKRSRIGGRSTVWCPQCQPC
ncbi:Fpg/Nei family DNA glycosylase [Saccharopolyspora rhizosphaerae]|uniref:Fpg/Nei family DNA glycosylase n=1 Tax=Saccharopolyspora rhizosphaerae TaxID=2492662 RepID=A0A3R8VGF1_9PSEU|nr:DNA-formamidopyrimidine glycosylase family protein [Saccharopolyspora rhizosphaerae]RRO16987.1 Fpg/Nei family DNA glycosylase [Saccharopolyspora rhizosphaerae]